MHRLLLNTVSIQHSCRFPNTENTMVRSTTKMLDRNSLFLLFFFFSSFSLFLFPSPVSQMSFELPWWETETGRCNYVKSLGEI